MTSPSPSLITSAVKPHPKVKGREGHFCFWVTGDSTA